jgi:hypothetical protein
MLPKTMGSRPSSLHIKTHDTFLGALTIEAIS